MLISISKKKYLSDYYDGQEYEEEFLSKLLTKYGLYRLKGYFKPLLIENANGKKICKVKLEKIEKIIILDENLRNIFLKYLLKIEYRFSLLLSEVLSKEKDPKWYCEILNFDFSSINKSPQAKHKELVAEVEKSTEIDNNGYHPHPGVSSFRRKNPRSTVPSWIVRECVSFGFWVHALDNLNKDLKEKIAKRVNFSIKGGRKKESLNPNALVSWMRSLNIIRNACAHNSLLINRNFSHNPSPLGDLFIIGDKGANLYPRIIVAELLLKSFFDENISNGFKSEIIECIKDFKNEEEDNSLIFTLLGIDFSKLSPKIDNPENK